MIRSPIVFAATVVALTVGLVVAIILVPGHGKERRLARWMADCTAHDFSVKQCELLFALKEGSEDDAAIAALAAGLAVGAANQSTR